MATNMLQFISYSLHVFYLLPVLIYIDANQDFVGCGGFLKSDIQINFSLVEIKLYTKQGSLKYQTDCAPNNGYYLIPLYDKGEYTLKVEPPAGWSFDPSNVSLRIDGSDPCTLGKDINFHFKGFSIIGTVLSRGQDLGPKGVTVLLKKQNEDSVLQSTITAASGSYSFPNIFPGDYTVSATHSKWKFLNSEANVKVVNANGKAEDSLVVAGYDVQGRVTSEGEPIRGVKFLLFSDDSTPPSVSDCSKDAVEGFTEKKKRTLLCHVESNQDGRFLFPVVPSGKYSLMSFYKGENIKFDVSPTEIKFTVAFDSVVLQETFKVEGFSVGGRVVASPNGNGIAGARILLNGEQQAESRDGGIFHLENMKAGSYVLQVIKDDIEFDSFDVKVTPNTPHLPEIVAKSFRVCGVLSVVHMPSGMDVNARRLVLIENENPQLQSFSVRTENDGKFCVYVARGQYKVKASVAEAEASVGLQFQPPTQLITVQDTPITGIAFQQYLASVKGRVKCKVPCTNVQFALKPIDEFHHELAAVVMAENNEFIFNSIMPGRYEVSVIKDEWCWKTKKIEITVDSTGTKTITFVHSGYVIIIISSHKTEVEYNSPSDSGVYTLEKGSNKLCLEKEGTYEIIPQGCHSFSKKKYTYVTSKPSILTLTATHHLLTGLIKSNDNVSDISIKIYSEENKENVKTISPVSLGKKSDGLFHYQFTYWATQGETLKFLPSSGKLLFYPPLQSLIALDDCMPDSVEFEGKKGLFLTGAIHPALENVQVTVSTLNETSGTNVVEMTVVTGTDGKYSAGPLHPNKHYEVGAQKNGYMLTKKQGSFDFVAFKLAEVLVKVTNNDDEPLAGVLLSLSGGKDYRQNTLTQQNGTMQFVGLNPGQYFLRPMLKEFSFDPSSTMIDIKEGTVVKLDLKGKRVAFSCFGTITSLAGDAEQDIIVEAVGIDDCKQFQEEAATESDGSFRIRGLQPHCTYHVRIKMAPEINQHIERSTPLFRKIMISNQDITNIRLIVFRHFNQMDLSGNVVTELEHLHTLKVHLFRDDNMDQMLHTVPLSSSSFFQFPSVPLDGRLYTIKLETSLSRSSFDYDLPHITLRANTSYRHFTLNFSPKVRSSEHEVYQGSLLAFPVAFFIIVLACSYKHLLPLVNQAFDLVQAVMNPARNIESFGNEHVDRKRKTKTRKIQ